MQSDDTTEERGLSAAVEAVARAFAQDRVGPGERAELRRMRPSALPPGAFWHVMARLVEPHHSAPSSEPERSRWEDRWATVLSGMAQLPHNRDRRPGQTLAETGFHELRLRRLLRASGGRLADELLNTARFLASEGGGLDWRQVARLVHHDPQVAPERANVVRRHIARDYFGTLFATQGAR